MWCNGLNSDLVLGNVFVLHKRKSEMSLPYLKIKHFFSLLLFVRKKNDLIHLASILHNKQEIGMQLTGKHDQEIRPYTGISSTGVIPSKPSNNIHHPCRTISFQAVKLRHKLGSGNFPTCTARSLT